MLPNEHLNKISEVVVSTESMAAQLSYLVTARKIEEEDAFKCLDLQGENLKYHGLSHCKHHVQLEENFLTIQGVAQLSF